MFGQHTDHQDQQDQQAHDDVQSSEQVVNGNFGGDPQVASAAQDWQHPGVPLDDSAQPVSDPAVVSSSDDQTTVTPTPVAVHPNDLLDIKQQALSQLSPLVGHLEQSPEEKFRTTMMMIQASDDQSLIQTAYDAAQAIPDEKTKAQALLDIVNEINYFTTQGQQLA